jgi:hypothetical protein
MFVLREQYTCAWPVKVAVPTTNGRVDRQEFTATFRVLSMERVRELTEGRPIESADVDLLREAWTGWDGVVDVDDNPVAFSHYDRDRMLSIPFVRRAVGEAFLAAMAGRLEKN